MTTLMRLTKKIVNRLKYAVSSSINSWLNTDRLVSSIVGPFSLILITGLVGYVILALYSCLLAWKLDEWPIWHFAWHWIVAHVVVANISFHFYYCSFSDPGKTCSSDASPNGKWCKKCSSPKPPLAHHCSVCKKCVNRMDHHCTWMNNCIGIANHRHFFLFCSIMTLACFYAYFSGSDLYYQHSLYGFGHINTKPVYDEQGFNSASLGYFKFDCSTNTMISLDKPSVDDSRIGTLKVHQNLHTFRNSARHHRFVMVLLYLCILFSLLLAMLTIWHVWLISCAITSIDDIAGTFQKCPKLRPASVLLNWKLFFGLLEPGSSLISNVILPYRRVPTPLTTWISKRTFETKQPSNV